MSQPASPLAARGITASATRCADARRRVIAMSHHANSAHLGSSLSCIEILDVIYARARIDADNAAADLRDRVIVSKGHAAMACYATLEQHGLLDDALLDAYLRDGTSLWGHVTRTPAVPAIDASSGSLGHGLSLAAGFALGHRLRQRDDLSVYCVLSDGECDEGATWEAALFAGARALHRLTAIVDYNKIQSLARTADVLDLEPFADKWQAFRWDVVAVDGHDSTALSRALDRTSATKPLLVIAHTVKGRGIARIEDTVASHYKPALASDLEAA